MSLAKHLWAVALVGGMAALAHDESEPGEPRGLKAERVIVEDAGGPGDQVEIERRELRRKGKEGEEDDGPRIKEKRGERREERKVLRLHSDDGRGPKKVTIEEHEEEESEDGRRPRIVKRFRVEPDGWGKDLQAFEWKLEGGGEDGPGPRVFKRFRPGPDQREKEIVIRRFPPLKELRFDMHKPFEPFVFKGMPEPKGPDGEVHHLREAIRHLHAAGLHDPAQKIEQELERRTRREPRGADARGDVRMELKRMRGELEETKRELKRLLQEEKENDRSDKHEKKERSEHEHERP